MSTVHSKELTHNHTVATYCMRLYLCFRDHMISLHLYTEAHAELWRERGLFEA